LDNLLDGESFANSLLQTEKLDGRSEIGSKV
jgi:hypothetical protein